MSAGCVTLIPVERAVLAQSTAPGGPRPAAGRLPPGSAADNLMQLRAAAAAMGVGDGAGGAAGRALAMAPGGDIQLELPDGDDSSGPASGTWPNPRPARASGSGPAATAAAAAVASAARHESDVAATRSAAAAAGVHLVMTAKDIAQQAAAAAAAMDAADAPGPRVAAGAAEATAAQQQQQHSGQKQQQHRRPKLAGRNVHYIELQRPLAGEPLPPAVEDGRISVIIMNWAKPDSVRQILNGLVAMEIVGEVIVLHLRADTAFEYAHERVTHLVDFQADLNYGLTSRILSCLRARHELVLLQDDDIMLTERAITVLAAAKGAAPAAPLVGFFGRDWGDRPGYVMAEVPPGHHPIALTVSVLATRALCAAFFERSAAAEPFVRVHSSPYWNGEDIFLSLVGWKSSGVMPLIVAPPKDGYKILHSQVSGAAMHTANPNHAVYRDAFTKVAVALLQLPTKGNGAPQAGAQAAAQRH